MTPWRLQSGEIGGAILCTELANACERPWQGARTLDSEISLLVDGDSEYEFFLLCTGGKVLVWDKGAERIFGRHERRALGQTYRNLFETRGRDTDQPAFLLARARGDGNFRERVWQLGKGVPNFLTGMGINHLAGEPNAAALGTDARDVSVDARQRAHPATLAVAGNPKAPLSLMAKVACTLFMKR